MSRNPEDRKKYQGMRRDIARLTADIEEAQARYGELMQQTDGYKKLIAKARADMSDRMGQITKLKKKRFGKSKAQAKIAELELEIENIGKVIQLQTDNIGIAQNAMETSNRDISAKVSELKSMQRDLDMFVNNCII